MAGRLLSPLLPGLSVAPSVWGWENANFRSSFSESPMNEVRTLPDSDGGSTSKLVDVEEECSAGAASSSMGRQGCASSYHRVKRSWDGHGTTVFTHTVQTNQLPALLASPRCWSGLYQAQVCWTVIFSHLVPLSGVWPHTTPAMICPQCKNKPLQIICCDSCLKSLVPADSCWCLPTYDSAGIFVQTSKIMLLCTSTPPYFSAKYVS